MKKVLITFAAVATLSFLGGSNAFADHCGGDHSHDHSDHDHGHEMMTAELGKPAPDFTLMSAEGNKHSLSEFKGKYVVLEWVNYDCPFVKKHYNSGNMQMLQEKYAEKDVVWLAICSSAPGKQGHFAGEDLAKRINSEKSKAVAYLMDTDGTVGKMYEAKTTPHMYVVDPEGVLQYMGAIDSKKSTKADDIPDSENYVVSALDALMADKEVATPATMPYGCSVKY